jgi:hypothetical protein
VSEKPSFQEGADLLWLACVFGKAHVFVGKSPAHRQMISRYYDYGTMIVGTMIILLVQC